MTDFAKRYRELGNEELLQLWEERSQLAAEAKSALHSEITIRHLRDEAEHARDTWEQRHEPNLAASRPSGNTADFC